MATQTHLSKFISFQGEGESNFKHTCLEQLKCHVRWMIWKLVKLYQGFYWFGEKCSGIFFEPPSLDIHSLHWQPLVKFMPVYNICNFGSPCLQVCSIGVGNIWYEVYDDNHDMKINHLSFWYNWHMCSVQYNSTTLMYPRGHFTSHILPDHTYVYNKQQTGVCQRQ